MTQFSEVGIDQLSGDLQRSVRSKISDKEVVLFCLLISDPKPETAVVITDYRLVIVSLKNGPFDHNGEMYLSLSSHNIRMYNGWALTPGLGSIGDVTVERETPFFGKSGWKVSFDLGYRDQLGKVEPLKLNFFDDEALAKKLVAVLKKAKNDAFVRERTPAPQASAVSDIGDQIAKLATLLEKGHLTQAEFGAAKKKLLGL